MKERIGLVYIAGVSNVVSVPNGATLNSNNLDYLDNCIDYFEDKEKIIIAVDNDPPGQALQSRPEHDGSNAGGGGLRNQPLLRCSGRGGRKCGHPAPDHVSGTLRGGPGQPSRSGARSARQSNGLLQPDIDRGA